MKLTRRDVDPSSHRRIRGDGEVELVTMIIELNVLDDLCRSLACEHKSCRDRRSHRQCCFHVEPFPLQCFQWAAQLSIDVVEESTLELSQTT